MSETENPSVIAGLAPGSETNAAMLQAGNDVLQRRNQDGSISKKRGRKPGTKNQTLDKGSDTEVDTPKVAPVVDKETVKKSVQAVMRTLDSFMMRRIYAHSLRLSGVKEFAEGMVEDSRITTDELETIGELSAVVCEKYALVGQYAPEIFLTIAIGSYGFRTYNTLSKLSDMQAAKLKETKAKNEPKPQADESISNGDKRNG